MRIVQLSDPHLSPTAPASTAAFERVVRWLNADPPAMVIVTGDLAELDPDSVSERRYAHRQLSSIDVPVLVLPGNHDVGENDVTPWRGPLVTFDRLTAYINLWRADRWVVELGGWRLVGVNLITPAPKNEVAWLAEQLVGAQQCAVFLHKPVYLVRPELVDEPGWSAEDGWRRELLEALQSPAVRIVASGHLHAFRRHSLWPGCDAVWAPSTYFPGKERGHGSELGPGLVEYWLQGSDWRVAYRSLDACDQ